MADPAPYGSWRSSFTSEALVEDVVRLSEVVVDGEDIYWNEGRPWEGGRQAIVRRRADGTTADVLGETFGARTLVHEYGGQSYVVAGGNVFFSNFADQRLYRVAPAEPGHESAPEALTAEPSPSMSVRFADPVVSPDGLWVVCVRERHLGPSAADVVNDIVAVPTMGGDPDVLVEGHDFFAAPRLSPDGAQLCWLSWDHPQMPWDGTELWLAPFDGGRLTAPPTPVAGSPSESVSQPRWSPDGRLHYVSDRTGWWNLYDAEGSSLWSGDVEMTGPDWVFGQSTYGFMADGAVVAAVADRNLWGLYVIRDGESQRVDTPWTVVSSLQLLPGSNDVVALVGSPTHSRAVATIEITTGDSAVLRRSRSDPGDERLIAVPEPVEFPTEGGTAHAFFYAPANPNYTGMPGELPPLIVMSHGGPTAAAQAVLDVGLQYWTSRGFAVVDVNYGGSTGYGRAYRERLNGRWGIVDVDDCIHAAAWLADQGRIDARRMVIRGQSAGGYTTLSALTFRDVFASGASHYGVADVEALALHTHKFESRYTDGLIGPYPEARHVYIERSPIHHTASLNRPMILFQGLDDKVVPPEQAEMMAGALREKGIPFAYLAFEGEQHGFRSADTMTRVAEAELWFYGQVLGFGPADEIEPVRVENHEALRGLGLE